MNDHLARRILMGVALFVLAVAGTLVLRSRSAAPRPDVVASTTPRADLEVTEVRLHEESGAGRLELIADRASVYDQEGRTALKNITVHVHERDRSWTIVGQEGDLYKESRDFEIRDRVVVTSGDGLRLETSVLRWKHAERRLWSDAPVTIARQGTTVSGRGLEVRLEDQVTTVRGRVRATFDRTAAR
jgi:LPS export ABC transporter protein LptC